MWEVLVKKYYITDSVDSENILNLLFKNFICSEHKPVLFPVDDIVAEILDTHFEKLKGYFFLPNINNTQGSIYSLMNKHYQKQLAKKAGLSVPEGWSVKVNQGKYAIPEGISFPCFVKPETPIPERKKYMGKCDNENALKEILNRVATNHNCLMLVEEYVEIEKEYGSVGVCDKRDVCIPGITEKTHIGNGSYAGVTVTGKIHDPSEYSDIVKKMNHMMSGIGLQGIFDIELYESKGIIYFNELNVRLGLEGVGTLIAGVNLAYMLMLVFLEPDEKIDYTIKANQITFVNEYPLSWDFAEGYISWKEYKQLIKKVDYRFIYSPNDKLPYFNFEFYILKQILRRLKKRKQ